MGKKIKLVDSNIVVCPLAKKCNVKYPKEDGCVACYPHEKIKHCSRFKCSNPTRPKGSTHCVPFIWELE
jgi:hypothetical protein